MRVLIVDPSKALQRYVRELLENFSFEPDQIGCADSPSVALTIGKKLRPDFLLTDWFAGSSLTGLGLFAALRQTAPLCQLALLGTTRDESLNAEAAQAQALFTLHKPCTVAELRTAIGAAIKEIAIRNPAVDSEVPDRALTAQRHLAALTYAAEGPRFKPGDRVNYQGKTSAVRHVLVRRSEVLLQLEGEPGLVDPEAVRRL